MKQITALLATILCFSSLYGQLSFSNQTFLLSDPFGKSGAPIAIADMNGDGLDDIVRLKNTNELQILYQPTFGTIFSNLTIGFTSGNQWSICIADVDRNGYNDIFCGGAYNGLQLFKASNDGLTYQDTAFIDPPIFLQGSNFVDIDGDLDVDIFACHDDGLSVPHENDGNGNFNANYDLIMTQTDLPSDNSGNYGSVWIDYDNDRDLDLYLSKCRLGVQNPNDPRRINMLFQNDGNGNYTNVAADAGLVPFGQSWATDFADIDNDGDLDAFIINHDIESKLYRNDGDGTFTDITAQSGMTADLSTIGDGIQVKFEDFDNDGFVDLFFTSNGSDHCLFLNDGDLSFTKLPNPFIGINERIHSAVTGDLNNDGFIDVYAAYGQGFNVVGDVPDQLYFNNGNDNHFFQVLLEGNISNPNGIGARVELYGEWGIQIREVRSGESYGIKPSFINHFGLGTATSIDSLVIRWPSGLIDRYDDLNIDSSVLLTEGEGCSTTADFVSTSNELEVAFTDQTAPGATFWIWEFGDGNTSLDQNPVHTYDTPGLYDVCLTVGGYCQIAQICKTVNVDCSAIQSLFTYNDVGQTVQFVDNSLNAPTEWFWTFGDGMTSNLQNPQHFYDAPGEYFVCLQTTSLCGQDDFCEVIQVGCVSPVAAFNVTNNDLMISLEDDSSPNIDEWFWIFGDGNISNEQSPDHTYDMPGTYEVCLTVNDFCGSDVTCELVTVGCVAPQANFDYISMSLAVAFQSLSPDATEFSWDFGDGNSNNVGNPLHTYAAPGTYEVCFTATNICGSDTFCQNVSVDCNAPISAFSTQANDLFVVFLDNTQNSPETWDWDFGDGNNSTLQNPSHTYATPGTYTACLTTTSICGSDQICQEVVVTCSPPMADYEFTQDELTFNFQDASEMGGTSWFWNFGNVGSSTQQNPVFTFSEPGTYEVCLTISNICGSNSICEFIDVICTAPQAGFELDQNDLTIDFTDISTGVVDDWLWNFGDGTTSTEANPQHTFDMPGTYAVCLQVSSICGNTQSCQLVTVDCAAPISAFEYISNQLNFAFIDQSANNPISWFWTFGDGQSSIEQNPTYSYSNVGIYEVCMTAASPCGMETSCQMVVATCVDPDADFEVTTDGLTVNFTDITTNNPDAWSWTFGNGSSSNLQNPSITFDAPGNYLVCLESSNACGEDQHCQQIEVSCAAPQSAFSFTANELQLSLMDLSTGGAETWIWTDPATGIVLSIDQNPIINFPAPGEYEICLIVGNICGNTTSCQTVSVSCNAPESSFSFVSNGLVVDFNDLSSNTPDSWLWEFGDGTTSTLASPDHTYDMPGTYTVCLTTSSICGSNTVCETVEVECQAPQAAFSLSLNELQVSFADNSSGSPEQWLWTFGDGNISNEASPIHVYASPGSYEVCLTVLNVCGNTQTCNTVQVDCSAPEAGFGFTQTELSFDFSDTSQNGPSSWLWTFGDGNSSTLANPNHVYDEPGAYEVCLTVSSICGETQTCQTIDVECSAPAPAFDTTGDQLVIQFNDNSSNNPTSWLWEFGDGTTSTEQNPEHTYELPGGYTICLTVSSICGSETLCESFIVSCTAPQADFDYGGDELVVDFSDNSMDNPDSWLWTFGDGTTSTDQNPQHEYELPGSYLVCLQVENVCGNTQRCELITVSCTPSAADIDFTANELEIQFTANPNGDIQQWLWNFGDGISATEQNPTHIYDMPGEYEVCLTVLSICGDSTICNTVNVSCTAPSANFEFDQSANTVQFVDISTNTPDEWLWDFGDGNTSTEQDPAHIYAAVGAYEVCLVSSSICGADTICQTLDVLVNTSTIADQLQDLQLYPNPTTAEVFFNWALPQDGEAQLRVWNTIGVLVKEQTTASAQSLDLNDLPAGTYYIETRLNDQKWIHKVIKL